MEAPSSFTYHTNAFTVSTVGRDYLDIGSQVESMIQQSEVATGQCTVFLHHTSASLILCENADPQVRRDLSQFFARLVPDGDPLFKHRAEGPDDMPAHIRTILTQNSLTIPIRDGHLDLGTWQGLFLWEQRTSSHRRRVTVSIVGAKKSYPA